jgi:hypothetical protein
MCGDPGSEQYRRKGMVQTEGNTVIVTSRKDMYGEYDVFVL